MLDSQIPKILRPPPLESIYVDYCWDYHKVQGHEGISCAQKRNFKYFKMNT